MVGALYRNAIGTIKIAKIDTNDIDTHINIKYHQSTDPFCKEIIKAINSEEVNKKIKIKSRQFILNNEILYYKKHTYNKNNINILVIPHSLIKSYHESPNGGHTGITRTIHKIQNKYYWSTLNKDTTNFIKLCHECQGNKKMSGKPIGLLNPLLVLSSKLLNRITFDYLGPLH